MAIEKNDPNEKTTLRAAAKGRDGGPEPARSAPGAGRERTQFYRTSSVNRGWIVKVFQERAEAVRWLHGKPDDARA